MIKLIHGDSSEEMKNIESGLIDGIITSPPYNTSRSGATDKYNSRYGEYNDSISNEDYIEWQTSLFRVMGEKLKKNGCILYNINYGSENTETMWLLIASIIEKTQFTVADQIIWKKKNAMPNNRSKNKLTRITENIFVFVRKTEFKTFNSNKRIKSVIEKTGQKNYENIFNFIEAPNKDIGAHTKDHKATYSTELCEKLISMYYAIDCLVLDPFMGSGTTGIACKNLNRNFIGIELDENYFNIAKERITGIKRNKKLRKKRNV